MMDKLKLQWKIFAFLLGFCFLLIAILWLFQTVFLSDMYKFTRKIEINKVMKLVEEEINNPNLEVILREIELTKEIIVRPTQDFVSPVPVSPGRDKPKEPETIKKTREYTLKNGTKISLTFYAIVTPVDATVSTLRIQLLIITAIILILAILFAVIISKRISKPIETINQGAKGVWQKEIMILKFRVRASWKSRSCRTL